MLEMLYPQHIMFFYHALDLGEVAVILIGSLRVFFCTDYPILYKSYELCPFMQTVLLH